MRWLLLIALAGCAAPAKWYKTGSTQEMFNMEQGQCQQQALSIPPPPQRAAMVYNACMRGKGWVLR